jgi:hypothetical protein
MAPVTSYLRCLIDVVLAYTVDRSFRSKLLAWIAAGDNIQ